MDQAERKSPEDIVKADGRYPLEAFAFLQEGLGRAIKQAHSSAAVGGRKQHVTGRQLSLALRDLAADKWGMMAKAVLEKWNIRASIDFGQMVYLLIEHGLMSKTEEDSLEDFRDVFDFDEAFSQAGQFRLKE